MVLRALWIFGGVAETEDDEEAVAEDENKDDEDVEGRADLLLQGPETLIFARTGDNVSDVEGDEDVDGNDFVAVPGRRGKNNTENCSKIGGQKRQPHIFWLNILRENLPAEVFFRGEGGGGFSPSSTLLGISIIESCDVMFDVSSLFSVSLSPAVAAAVEDALSNINKESK